MSRWGRWGDGVGWRRRLAMIIFSTAKRRKRSRRCPQQLVDILAVHITIRTSCSLVGIFVSWRWIARVVSGSEQVTRQTRAGREVTKRDDVPRDGNSGEDVVFSMPHLHRFRVLSLGTSYGHLASRRARRRRRGRDVKLPATSRATRRETEPDSKMHTSAQHASLFDRSVSRRVSEFHVASR